MTKREKNGEHVINLQKKYITTPFGRLIDEKDEEDENEEEEEEDYYDESNSGNVALLVIFSTVGMFFVVFGSMTILTKIIVKCRTGGERIPLSTQTKNENNGEMLQLI